MNFVPYNQDLSEPVSTILTAVDIHKGFYKIEHIKIIRILREEMKVPGWLLKIVASYLSSQKLRIRYRRETSTSRPMAWGTAAETILGLTFFLVIFNGAGPATNCVSIGKQISQPRKKRKLIQKAKVLLLLLYCKLLILLLLLQLLQPAGSQVRVSPSRPLRLPPTTPIWATIGLFRHRLKYNVKTFKK